MRLWRGPTPDLTTLPRPYLARQRTPPSIPPPLAIATRHLSLVGAGYFPRQIFVYNSPCMYILIRKQTVEKLQTFVIVTMSVQVVTLTKQFLIVFFIQMNTAQ